MKNSNLNKKLKQIESKADELRSIRFKLRELDRLIATLKTSNKYTFSYKHKDFLPPELIVNINPPYEKKEQQIINDFKNNLLKFYINQKRRLIYKINKFE